MCTYNVNSLMLKSSKKWHHKNYFSENDVNVESQFKVKTYIEDCNGVLNTFFYQTKQWKDDCANILEKW